MLNDDDDDDEEVSIQAYELWWSITDIEIERIKLGKKINYYSKKALNDLFGVISYHTLNRDKKKEKEDPYDLNLSKAAFILLQNLSQCVSDESFI